MSMVGDPEAPKHLRSGTVSTREGLGLAANNRSLGRNCLKQIRGVLFLMH